MRTHTKTFHIRFTELEYERLCKFSARAGLPKSTYIRFMINGQSPKDHPPIDFHKMMNELRSISNTLNQLARIANQFGSLHAKRLEDALVSLNEKYTEIFDAVILPAQYDKVEILARGKLQTEKDKEEL